MSDKERLHLIQSIQRAVPAATDGMINVSVEAANEIVELLKERETVLERNGHHIHCQKCGEYWCDTDRELDPFPMNFCPSCGRKATNDS